MEVNAPLQTVYNQWTRFEEFPRFMDGVDEVRQDGPNRLFWKAKIGGKEKQWEAEITEQVPNTRIAWRSVDGASNRGAITFEELDVLQTRITLTMEYEPEGFFEQAGDALGIPLGQVAEDLNRFREFMENRGSQPDASRGQTEPVETPNSTDQAMKEGNALSVEESTERKTSSQHREIAPAAILTEAIVSGMWGIGSERVGARDESFQKGEQNAEVAEGPEAMAENQSGVAESMEIDRGRVGGAAPTHEQIARRAYELYLERGQEPGDAREDWLTAEKELAEKPRDNRPA
jgi:Polyketide cyclase / dehydrase and lipid transport/Protein of unknown function (DUF2934)